MIKFRGRMPKRRNINREVNHYKEHRNDLIIDFNNRCGYCDDVDTWRINWFEIDHFVPQKSMINIKSTDYFNLVYACRSCNNAKRAKWVTEDEEIHNLNNQGFIDPCSDEYDNQFLRSKNGRIIPQTKLGEWIYNNLKLYKPHHEVIWNIEQLDILIDEIEDVLNDYSNESIKSMLITLYRKYRYYTKQLSSVG